MKNALKQGVLYTYALLSAIRIVLLAAFLRLMRKKIALLLAGPTHANLGDHAIAYAEKRFVSSHLPEYRVIETGLLHKKILDIELYVSTKIVRQDDIILGIGGGNMGDQYPIEEYARQTVISSFPRNKVIIFPQTVYYGKSDVALRMLDASRKVYSGHPDLTLVAREQRSYEMMQEYFPGNTIHLAPDIVLSLQEYSEDVGRKGAMTCLRSDVEKSIGSDSDKKIVSILRRKYGEVNISDTISDDFRIVTGRLRRRRLKSKWREFRSSKVVVTDRLHGMVFAAITGTPCVVFSNYNHKVAGTYEWIKDLPNIQFCERIEDLELAIERATSQPYRKVPNFSKYWASMLEGIS